MPKKIILDCDPGHDDAIAILMAVRIPEIELLGITTVAGNSPLEDVTQNTLRVLDVLGVDVPVAVGSGKQIAKKYVKGTADGETGLDGSKYLPPSSRKVLDIHAVDLIAKILEESSEPVTLAPTGPLTNIALFLMKYPHLKPKIKEIVLMGGAVLRRDKFITSTEFNIVSDPIAAQIVVESGVKTTFVGLDVTMHVCVETEQYRRLNEINTDLSRLVVDWCHFYEKLHRGTMGVGGALHDPLVIAAIANPGLLKSVPVEMTIEQGTGMLSGATVAEYWGKNAETSNVYAALEVDSEGFFEMLYASLK
ncbi:MAG: nucleoside hydrolase [Brevinema sp.]